MLRGADTDYGSLAELFKRKRGFLLFTSDAQSRVYLIIFHQLQKRGKRIHPDGGPELGKFSRELPENRRKQFQLRVVVAAQLQGQQMFRSSQPLPCRESGLQDKPRVGKKQEALRRKRHVPSCAVKKLYIQLLLQRLNLMADRRLRDF